MPRAMNHYVTEPSFQTPVIRNAEIVVCGGGPAGISAAIAAARSGARTVLLEGAGCLGGIWTSGLLAYVLDPKPDSAVTALLISELERYGAKSENKRLDLIRDRYDWAKH